MILTKDNLLDLQADEDRPKVPELFISYASADYARAAALHAHLVEEGFRVWFDKVRLIPGCDWHKEIEAGCDAAHIIVPLITPGWAKSEWTRYETYAHDVVIPVLAEGRAEDVMPQPLRRWNAVALDPLATNAAAWQALLAAIRTKLAEPVPERTPRIVDLPYPANPFFTGRDDDLVRLHEELHASPIAALTQSRVRALAAMGGIGKTALANEYARRFWRLYDRILWIDARAGLENGFASKFQRLFPTRANAGLQQNDMAQAMLTELSGPAERLLVLDNVEDVESVRPWLVRDPTSGCRTLITSRFADWPQAEGIRTININVLEPEPSRTFLMARTGRMAEREELVACNELARGLGYLPLALEQAAAYIAAPGAGVNFADYLRLYRAAAAELLTRGALGSTAYPDPVITTWQATVMKLSPESRAVLRLCAWYADTPIPRTLVTEGSKEVLALAAAFGPVLPLSGPEAATLRMRDALVGLARYSMVLDTTDSTFRVHALVQAVEREHATREGDSEVTIMTAILRMVIAFPNGQSDPTTWPLCRQLLPHQVALLSYVTVPEKSHNLLSLRSRRGELNKVNAVMRLLSDAGRFLLDVGDAAGALPLLRRAMETSESFYGPDWPATVIYTDCVAECMRQLGYVSDALSLARRVLERIDPIIGPEDPRTLTAASHLAGCLMSAGDCDAALPLLLRVLECRQKILGLEHPTTLASAHTLADCMMRLGNVAASLPAFHSVVELRKQVLGPEHLDTLNSLGSLAICMLTIGDATNALPLFRQVQQGRERVLGSEHPDTLKSLHDLAICNLGVDDFGSALQLYTGALAGRKRVLGLEHPDTLSSAHNLGAIGLRVGDVARASELYRLAYEGRKRRLGPEHPETLSSAHGLANCMAQLGDEGGALSLYGAVLQSRQQALGPRHPDTLTSVESFADFGAKIGKGADVLRFYRHVLEGREQVLGREHPDTLGIVKKLAEFLHAQGDLLGAQPLYQRALEGFERLLGPDHSTTRAVRSKRDQAAREH